MGVATPAKPTTRLDLRRESSSSKCLVRTMESVGIRLSEVDGLVGNSTGYCRFQFLFPWNTWNKLLNSMVKMCVFIFFTMASLSWQPSLFHSCITVPSSPIPLGKETVWQPELCLRKSSTVGLFTQTRSPLFFDLPQIFFEKTPHHLEAFSCFDIS